MGHYGWEGEILIMSPSILASVATHANQITPQETCSDHPNYCSGNEGHDLRRRRNVSLPPNGPSQEHCQHQILSQRQFWTCAQTASQATQAVHSGIELRTILYGVMKLRKWDTKGYDGMNVRTGDRCPSCGKIKRGAVVGKIVLSNHQLLIGRIM